MAARYFADVGLDRPRGRPYFVWRRVRKPFSDTQRFDRKARRWISDPSLLAYVYNGEIGSVVISEEEAELATRG